MRWTRRGFQPLRRSQRCEAPRASRAVWRARLWLPVTLPRMIATRAHWYTWLNELHVHRESRVGLGKGAVCKLDRSPCTHLASAACERETGKLLSRLCPGARRPAAPPFAVSWSMESCWPCLRHASWLSSRQPASTGCLIRCNIRQSSNPLMRSTSSRAAISLSTIASCILDTDHRQVLGICYSDHTKHDTVHGVPD